MALDFHVLHDLEANCFVDLQQGRNRVDWTKSGVEATHGIPDAVAAHGRELEMWHPPVPVGSTLLRHALEMEEDLVDDLV